MKIWFVSLTSITLAMALDVMICLQPLNSRVLLCEHSGKDQQAE